MLKGKLEMTFRLCSTNSIQTLRERLMLHIFGMKKFPKISRIKFKSPPNRFQNCLVILKVETFVQTNNFNLWNDNNLNKFLNKTKSMLKNFFKKFNLPFFSFTSNPKCNVPRLYRLTKIQRVGMSFRHVVGLTIWLSMQFTTA